MAMEIDPNLVGMQPKESKEQKRSRLNREGREFIRTGQHHLVTEQHKTAMDYMTRKNARKEEARKSFKAEGSGNKGSVATGLEPAKNEKEAEKAKTFDWDTAKVARVRDKIAEVANSIERAHPGSSFPGISKRSIPNGAINTDSTHHVMMATIADHLSDKLEEAQDNGQLLSSNARSIDDALNGAHEAITGSNIAHDYGKVELAKLQMQAAQRHLHSAAVQMRSKGVTLHPKTEQAIADTATGYTRSTAPGQGAMPHEKFDPMRRTKLTPVVKKSTEPKLTGSDYVRMGKGMEEKMPTTDFEPIQPEEDYTSDQAMSQQLRHLGY